MFDETYVTLSHLISGMSDIADNIADSIANSIANSGTFVGQRFETKHVTERKLHEYRDPRLEYRETQMAHRFMTLGTE